MGWVRLGLVFWASSYSSGEMEAFVGISVFCRPHVASLRVGVCSAASRRHGDGMPARQFLHSKARLMMQASEGGGDDGKSESGTGSVASSPAQVVSENKVPVKGPQVPEGFTPPTPKTFQVRPDQLLNIASGSVSSLARVYSGAVVSGYSLSIKNGSLNEKSTTLPASRPMQPLVLFDMEACPFCRKVREALCILDLEVYVYPSPKSGLRFRPLLKELGGKAQFPYLIDPNTDFAAYESDDIVAYLFKTYGDGAVPLSLRLGALTNFSAGLSSLLRGRRGASTPSKKVFPEKALQMWGYEPSPFCKVVREKLCELELPYLLYNTARGSPQRAALKEKVGRFQVPYLVDENTGVKMFESAEICEYLDNVYGPNAAGSVAELPEELVGVMPKLELSE